MKYLEILGASAPGPQRGSCLLSKSRTAFLAPLVPSFHMPYWNSVLSQSCQANGIAQTAWKNHCMRGRGGRFLETNTKEVWRGCGHIFSEEQKLKLQMFDTCWNLVQQTRVGFISSLHCCIWSRTKNRTDIDSYWKSYNVKEVKRTCSETINDY